MHLLFVSAVVSDHARADFSPEHLIVQIKKVTGEKQALEALFGDVTFCLSEFRRPKAMPTSATLSYTFHLYSAAFLQLFCGNQAEKVQYLKVLI